MHRIAIGVFILFALSGCSASYVIDRKPATGSLNAFASVVIDNVDTGAWFTSHPEIRDGEDFTEWRNQISLAETQIAAAAKNYLNRYGRYAIQTKPDEKSLMVVSELIDFEPGFGDDRRRVAVRVELMNAKTGEKLGEARVFGKTNILGDLNEAFTQCGKGIARFILDHYAQPSQKYEK